jgi:hypothetical protein
LRPLARTKLTDLVPQLEDRWHLGWREATAGERLTRERLGRVETTHRSLPGDVVRLGELPGRGLALPIDPPQGELVDLWPACAWSRTTSPRVTSSTEPIRPGRAPIRPPYHACGYPCG